MQRKMFKTSIYAAIALTSVLMAHNAIVEAAISEEIIEVTSAKLKTTDRIDVVVKFVELGHSEFTKAIGDSDLNAIEVSELSDLPSINTMLTKSNWNYVIQISESRPDTLEVGTYKAELFENNLAKGSLFFKQIDTNSEILEGVIAVWDIGHELPTNVIYTVKITKSQTDEQGGDIVI